jgi:hypothetical protein
MLDVKTELVLGERERRLVQPVLPGRAIGVVGLHPVDRGPEVAEVLRVALVALLVRVEERRVLLGLIGVVDLLARVLEPAVPVGVVGRRMVERVAPVLDVLEERARVHPPLLKVLIDLRVLLAGDPVGEILLGALPVIEVRVIGLDRAEGVLDPREERLRRRLPGVVVLNELPVIARPALRELGVERVADVAEPDVVRLHLRDRGLVVGDRRVEPLLLRLRAADPIDRVVELVLRRLAALSVRVGRVQRLGQRRGVIRVRREAVPPRDFDAVHLEVGEVRADVVLAEVPEGAGAEWVGGGGEPAGACHVREPGSRCPCGSPAARGAAPAASAAAGGRSRPSASGGQASWRAGAQPAGEPASSRV